jgi:hypothetical protein
MRLYALKNKNGYFKKDEGRREIIVSLAKTTVTSNRDANEMNYLREKA